MTHDSVERPSHYTHAENGIVCIDAIRAALGREGFIAFLRGQVIRYQWRLGRKGPAAEDAGKAHWYAAKLEEVLKEGAEDCNKQPAQRGWPGIPEAAEQVSAKAALMTTQEE